jgi:hypothetical protein
MVEDDDGNNDEGIGGAGGIVDEDIGGAEGIIDEGIGGAGGIIDEGIGGAEGMVDVLVVVNGGNDESEQKRLFTVTNKYLFTYVTDANNQVSLLHESFKLKNIT